MNRVDDDIYICQLIILIDEFDWDPSNNLFGTSLMEQEYRTSSNFYHYINIVQGIILIAPPTIQSRDELDIHEFDRSMANV